MSAASSFPPPLAQLPVYSEHLSVHTMMEGVNLHQSLPSAAESIDEVQLGFDAHTDELSMDEDRAQIDELEEDLNESLQYPSNPDLHFNTDRVSGEPELVETPKLAEQAHGQSDAISVAPDQPVSIEQPTEEPPQTDVETKELVSKTDAILQAEALGTTTATDGAHFISPEEQDNLEVPEGEDLGFSVPLTEQEISVMAQNFALEIEEMTIEPSEPQSGEQDSNQPDLQPIESEVVVTPEPVVEIHEDAGAPPLRRMDENTIPVTAHSKDSIIDVLNASSTTADESVQPTTAAEQAPQESEIAASTELVPEQVDMELVTQDVVQPEERTPASVMVHVEHAQISETSKQGEGEDIVMEQEQAVVDTTVEASIDHQPIQIIQDGSDLAAQDKLATSDPVLDDPIAASGDVVEPAVTAIEHSATIVEETPVQETEQPEPSTADPVPEASMDITTTSVATTVISTNPVVVDSVISTTGAGTGDMEIDPIERAAQIQLEQDATAQITEDVTETTLVAEFVATTNDVVATDETPDPTAPEDSDSSHHAASQSEPQPDSAAPQAADSSDPLITQAGELDTPEESSEPTKTQYQISLKEPEITPGTGPFSRQKPEWEGFAALDEDAPGSPEPELSSEPSEHEGTPLNPTSASTDKAKEPEEPSNSSTAPARKKKKPRMIMEVVIPIAPSKPKVAQETKPVRKRGRPAKASKSAKAPASSKPEPVVASSSFPQRRSSSAGTPTESSESELEPAPQIKKPATKLPRSYSSRRRFKAAASGSSARPVHVAHAAKLEVVIPRKPRPSVLRTAGRRSSGNNVKFVSVPPVTGKRKAESEPEVDEEGSDADADGETDEEYEDVEEEPKVKLEVVISPRPQKTTRAIVKAKKTSPVKRPRRSREARKTPAKLPETVSKGSRSPPKRRRLRR
ncbi:unnamed protein product [Rhizoctonia solani]|nr:unnamed protein product [Rhizoctonia solani]